MSDENANAEERAPCDVCKALVSPVQAPDEQMQRFVEHLTDYDDPHRTLQLVPRTHFGNGAPSAGDGYRAGDTYVDVSGSATYSYRKVSESPEAFQWVRGTPDVQAFLSPYVFVEPVSGAYPERNLSAILAAYLKSSDAASAYATKTALAALSATVSDLSTATGSYVFRSGGAGVTRDIDSILAGYVRSDDIGTYLTGKQDRLIAGTGVSISQNGVISVSVPSIPPATTTTDGLMPAAYMAYVDTLPAALRGLQPKLTQANAGAGVSISPSGVISATVYGAATPSSNGLMSAADKAKLDSIPAGSGSQYTLPIASYSALGGVKVGAFAVEDYDDDGAYVQPVGYSMLEIGWSGFAYIKDPDVASWSKAGVVKVDSSILSDTRGYYKCKVDSDGFVYYGTAESTVATGTSLGSVMVDPTVLTDTTGYAPCKIDSDGRIYYMTAAVSPASSSVLGGVYVDGTKVTTDDTDWALIRTDSLGYAYYRENVASSSSLGHVKVSPTVLSDPSGYSMCLVDANGVLYAPSQPAASAAAAGVVMVDSTAVDSTDPGEYVKCRTDEDGVVYSKGYDDAIAQLRHQGAGHDIMVNAPVVSNVVTVTNNAMNYVPVTGPATYSVKVPERLQPSTNARDFFIVLAFGSTWSQNDQFYIGSVISPTTGETPKVFAADGEQLAFDGIAPGTNVILYFTEITSGVFVVSRKTTTRIF